MTIDLWHGYRGDEKTALESVVQSYNMTHSDVQVETLAVPFDALGEKLRMTIPLGTGPDIFIGGQSWVGMGAENGLIIPIEYYIDSDLTGDFFVNVMNAFHYMYPEAVWGIPGSFKNIALYYNTDLIDNPPDSADEIFEIAEEFTDPNYGQFGKYGFLYEVGNFYYHTMWVQGFGGRLFREVGVTSAGISIFLPLLYSEPMIDAGNYVLEKIVNAGLSPASIDGSLVTQMFNAENAMFVLNGQWFRGEIDDRIDYDVAKPPIIDELGTRAVPFLTCEGFFVTSCAKDQIAAVEVIEFMSSAPMQKVFAETGGQTPANKKAYEYTVVADDPIGKIFKEAAGSAVSVPNIAEMSLCWDPATRALGDILNGGDPATVLLEKQLEFMAVIEADKGIDFADYDYDPAEISSLLDIDPEM